MKQIGIFLALFLLGIIKLPAQSAIDKTISKDQIIGTWAVDGEKKPMFVIEKNKIFYPDLKSSYKYSLSKDTIRIKYDGFDGNYLVLKPSADTMIFIGNEKQLYYRLRQ